MKNYLLNQIKLTSTNNALFFENYAMTIALKLLNDKGENALKVAINQNINDKLTSSHQKLFFIELNNKFN